MKQTSSFGSTKGLCQIARLTLLTPSIPTLKIPQLHNYRHFAFQPELRGLWPCCYGHIPKVTFGLLVSTLPLTTCLINKHDKEGPWLHSNPVLTYGFCKSTCNNFPGGPSFPWTQPSGFCPFSTKKPYAFQYPIFVIKTIEPKILFYPPYKLIG